MSFFKRLFGMGGDDSESAASSGGKVAKEIDHKGFTVRATPFKQDGQYQTSGVVSKEIGGISKEHKFVRADRFSSLDDAVDVSIRKGMQIIDEQGDRLFGP